MFHLELYYLWLITIAYLYIHSIFSTNAVCKTNNGTSTLKMVHVLFRHGDRVNDQHNRYPLDPYINETFEPYGKGQLTNNGKRKEYAIGKKLRKRYNTFLGPLYRAKDVEAISTDTIRTKMSLLLVLASLFPPKRTALEWDMELNWQPIAYDYVPFEKERLLPLPLFVCPNYVTLYNKYLHSSDGLQIQQKYKYLYKYLTKYTGIQINSTNDILGIYLGLMSELSYGLRLPDWTEPVFPNYMEKAVIDEYTMFTATTGLKRLSGGFLLRKIMDDMKHYINGKLTRKLSLYSAHEMNVVFLLSVLEVYFPHIPPYGAYVLIELHKKNKTHCVQIYYQDYTRLKLKRLKIPTCQYCCPFSRFVSLLSNNLPRHNDTCGED